MPRFLKHLQVFVCIFIFPAWPWEQFYAGTSNSACVAQILVYMFMFCSVCSLLLAAVILFSKIIEILLGYFDAMKNRLS